MSDKSRVVGSGENRRVVRCKPANRQQLMLRSVDGKRGQKRGKRGQTSLFRYFYFAPLDQILFQTHELLSEPILLPHPLFHLRHPLAQRNRITNPAPQ